MSRPHPKQPLHDCGYLDKLNEFVSRKISSHIHCAVTIVSGMPASLAIWNLGDDCDECTSGQSKRSTPESGYALLVIMFFLALLVVSLSAMTQPH